MRKTIFVLALTFIFTLAAADVFAPLGFARDRLAVTVRSTSGGTYESGKFTAAESVFEAKYAIDEAGKTVKLEEVIRNNREGKIDKGALYEITNIVVSEGISAMFVSRDKKGQYIITAVREAAIGASEILVIGEDFYEYCSGANGKFYLESGEILSGKKRD